VRHTLSAAYYENMTEKQHLNEFAKFSRGCFGDRSDSGEIRKIERVVMGGGK
jgi:hypothetical protein